EKLLGGISAQQLVKEITEIVIKQQSESLRILNVIENELAKENIDIINEKELDSEQQQFVKEFYLQRLSPALVTIILNDLAEFPLLRDTSGYLAVKLVMNPTPQNKREVRYAIIEMPNTINRF